MWGEMAKLGLEAESEDVTNLLSSHDTSLIDKEFSL